MERKWEIDGVLHLKHYFHEHVLALVDINQSEEEVAAYCQGCCQVVSGPCFSCPNSDCNYHLHQNCAQLPYYIDNHRHPLHVEHLDSYSIRFSLRQRNDYLEYVGENFYQSKDEAHQLAFHLFENHKDYKLIKTVPCSWCHEPLADSTYVSADLKFHLHKSCFDQLPTQIDHPCHRIHPLILEFDNKNRFCKLCQKGDDKHFFYYHCVACNFDIHLQCIWPRPVIEDHKRYHIHHEHPFTLHWRQDSFTCDACGTNGNSASYIATTLPTWNVPQEILVYMDVIEDETVAEDMEDRSSFRVIEQNKDGEATKIRHFLHNEDEHDLVLLDQMKQQHDSRCCDGCVVSLSISGSAEGSDRPFYYSCLKCDFVLHKGCAELPKKKHHWYHRFLTTLQPAQSYFYCCLCDHRCSGFCYQSLTNQGIGMSKCLRCVKTPDIIKSGQVHKHKVFFDHKCKGECNACGRSIDEMGSFRCKDCSNFTLDFACLTLPPTVEHKSVCDQHLLQLITYNATQEEEEEEEEAYCDICEICETKRDPKDWYYHCGICDTSAHPKFMSTLLNALDVVSIVKIYFFNVLLATIFDTSPAVHDLWNFIAFWQTGSSAASIWKNIIQMIRDSNQAKE
ncbi:C1-like protein [Corchorus olitorius]|uniref:C1-like protein n=1 Tax=Corchorus olitorius TaxID=93759 RepID=A0A1R3HNH0_9ROSI|nr:C1-like protein [Corchorus olitorius]